MAEGNQDESVGHTALFILNSDNAFRKKCKSIVEWTVFEYIILLVIIVNCVCVGIGLYIPEDHEAIPALEKAEIVFFVIFVIEMLLKMFSYGFVLHPGSYLRNAWNVLDFTVIVMGVISMFPIGLDLNVIRMLRGLRLLRLLRLIKLLRKKD